MAYSQSVPIPERRSAADPLVGCPQQVDRRFISALNTTDYTDEKKTVILAHLRAVEAQAMKRRASSNAGASDVGGGGGFRGGGGGCGGCGGFRGGGG